MKNLIAFTCVFFISFSFLGQVGINTTNPQASLDIPSSSITAPAATDGILIPRMDVFPSSNPTAAQDGMLVLITGNSTQTKGLYYWDHGASSWQSTTGANRVNDLIDGKSDNDGTDDGSSIFLGIGSGTNDDGTNNFNVGIGFEALQTNATGNGNVALGWQARQNGNANENVAIGLISQQENTGTRNTSIGAYTLTGTGNGSNNVAIGALAGSNTANYSNNIFIGNSAGSGITENNRLYIGSGSPSLIYGEMDTDILRVNGTFEVNDPSVNGYAFPATDGNTNYVIATDGSGSLTWRDPSTLIGGGPWERFSNRVRFSNAGDFLFFRTNELIELENASSTPEPFIRLYQTNSGGNVERAIITESFGSNYQMRFDPTENAFSFNNSSLEKVNIDLDATVPLNVLGPITLGNVGNQFTLPNNNGTNNQFLVTDGAGGTSWETWSALDVGFWDRTTTNLSPLNPGDDLQFGPTERIVLENVTTTPQPFLNLYTSNVGSNVERAIMVESLGSNFQMRYDPTENAFSFNNSSLEKVNIDLDATVPLNVLGPITLGNVGNQFTLPNNNGTNNQFLVTDGAGGTSWQDDPSPSLWTRSGNTISLLNTGDDISFTSDQTSITFPASTGTPAPMLYLFSGGTTNSNKMVMAHSTGFNNWGLQYSDVDDAFRFVSNGSTVVEVDLFIGVGDTAMTVNGDLSVNGDVITDTTTYPDYVFEKYYNGHSQLNETYDFKSLTEVENFIKEKGHLPNVKSYAAIEAQGMKLDLTEATITNLEKIEEAYLYLIELKQENEKLRVQLKTQNELLDSIEQRLIKLESNK